MVENKANSGNKANKRVIKGEGYKIVDDVSEFSIVKFLDIDTNKITFGNSKKNNYNGTQIPILYNGKTMYVIYEGTSPFGVQENVDNGNYLGTSMQINLEGEISKKQKN